MKYTAVNFVLLTPSITNTT